MLKDKAYIASEHSERLFNVLSSPRFLNKEGLGGELPFFVHSFPISKQTEVETQLPVLVKRLHAEGVEVLDIHLYELCLDILKRENRFDQIIAREKQLRKPMLMRTLSDNLNVESILIPEIHRKRAESKAKIVFLTGIAAAFPFMRSHHILNNIQTLTDNIPLVMFFPGTYDNQSLTLFNLLKDDNYYRAHNLNEYNI